MSRVRNHNRILTCDGREIEFSGESAINLSDDTVFQFLSEECEGSSPVSSIDGVSNDEEETGNEDENGNEDRGTEVDNYWETQHELLQSTICRTSALESRIRNITKEVLKEAGSKVCSCSRAANTGCRNCLMAEICCRLQNAGLNGAICKSKWRSSPDIPSGEHTFVDVVDSSNPKKGQVRVIIELNFRAEFEMARANNEYNKLINRLPETFVGKIERLLSLIKILCGAAKKCMKETKMHMGPWRKQRYMQAKWLRTRERMAASQPSLSDYSARPARPRMSMLTVDLMENFSTLHRPTVAVV
ncbi:uncharacterized protein LOC127249793 [Andrographis paniculata]|uniref:uncharacterized protein LOC127249793 n=1 Tax=Andrographis paniculata TaxID=175694 RepID=UPI0021E70FFD|nr:uncharacterized protein LOC127249793 [Andrographis paniculata]